MVITFEAIYKDGVLKPLEPLNLREGERVEISLVTGPEQAAEFRLEDCLKPFLSGPPPDADELEDFLKTEHRKSLDRLLRQIDGDFEEKE